MVPSSTVPPYSSTSFPTRIVPSVSPPVAPTASPTLGVPSGSEGRSGSIPPIGPRKHELSYDIGLSPESTASPPATGPHIGPDGSLSTGEDQRANKRRKNGPGSRGVANLTPEQLAKKRANDREAQRAVRERTKHQIEQLENRIRELTSLQPYQELQAVIRAKEAVEAENAEIKSRLASIMALIQPVLSGHQGTGETHAPLMHNVLPEHPGPPPVPNSRSPANKPSPDASTSAPSTTAASPITIDTPPYSSGRHPNVSPQPQLIPRISQVKVVGQRRQDLLHNLDLGAGEQLQLNFLLDPTQRVNKFQNGLHETRDASPACQQHLLMKQEWSGASFPVSPTHGDPGMGDGSQHHQQQPDINPASGLPTQSESSESWVAYSAPIKNCPPTSTLDNLLLAFIHERRQRAAEGIPTQEVVGPRYPSVSSLLNPATNAYVHPMSKVFADILTTFSGLCTLPERVAVLYCMFLNMRWWINPSQENFDLLPRWARPVPAQQSTPHPAWIDHVPFPRMREKLVREYNPSEYLFDNFFIPYTATLSVNWPYEPEDALLQTADNSELLINPVFERHLRRLENWTLGEDFDRTYPQLRGAYNLKMTMKTQTTATEPSTTTSVAGVNLQNNASVGVGSSSNMNVNMNTNTHAHANANHGNHKGMNTII